MLLLLNRHIFPESVQVRPVPNSKLSGTVVARLFTCQIDAIPVTQPDQSTSTSLYLLAHNGAI